MPWKPLSEVPLTRIFPPGDGTATPGEAISGLGLGARAPDDRPYLVLNMVSSADGKAAIEGRTRDLGDEADRAIFHHLRTQADAVMVGAGTVRVERYGRIVKDEGLREKRVREGLEPDALAVIVSRSLDLDPAIPIFQEPEQRIVILTAADRELDGVAAHVEYLRSDHATWDIRPLVRELRERYGVRSVLCEGGPTLNASLLPYGLVDELFLSIAPLLAGGRDALTIVAGEPFPEPIGLGLVWAYEHGSHLFLRYQLRM